MTTPSADPGGDALRSLLRASRLMAPDQLGGAVVAAARLLGATETVVHLTDYEQSVLVPLTVAGTEDRPEVAVEGTLAGRAFTRLEMVDRPTADGGHRLWVPLLDGVERLGVVEFLFPAALDPAGQEEVQVFVALVAELIVDKNAYGDVFARLRRRKPLSLAAEIQWGLLPPLTFGTDRLVITGVLEPAYEIGGDTFDYAVNGHTADLVMLDSVGHGLPAAVLATLAVGAYRHARRAGADLPEAAVAIDSALASQIGASQFATAVLARLDVDTGRLRWVNAGHPPPLVLRGTSLVQLPTHRPDRPLGLLAGVPTAHETRLEPGDRVLFYTDGITEARSPTGDFFGEQRLADLVTVAMAAGVPAPETMRRLMAQVLSHQAGRLQDDASILLLEWRTGDEQQFDSRTAQ